MNGRRAAPAHDRVLTGDWAGCERLVLAQSTSEATDQAVMATAGSDCRVCYRRLPSCAKTVAVNTDLMLSRAVLLAFLDDDSAAWPEWLAHSVWACAVDARLMLLASAVVAGPHDPGPGVLPTVAPPQRHDGLRGLTCGQNPMGANLALRRALPQSIGLFDPHWGAGAPWRSSYALAYCYRTYRLGGRIGVDSQSVVVHRGFRSWAEGRRLVQGSASAYTAEPSSVSQPLFDYTPLAGQSTNALLIVNDTNVHAFGALRASESPAPGTGSEKRGVSTRRANRRRLQDYTLSNLNRSCLMPADEAVVSLAMSG